MVNCIAHATFADNDQNFGQSHDYAKMSLNDPASRFANTLSQLKPSLRYCHNVTRTDLSENVAIGFYIFN